MAKPTPSTKILASRPARSMGIMEPESRSVEVRQITNGFLIRESVCKDGDYKSQETFSATKPNLEAATSPETTSPGNSLAAAVGVLRGR